MEQSWRQRNVPHSGRALRAASISAFYFGKRTKGRGMKFLNPAYLEISKIIALRGARSGIARPSMLA